MINIYKISSEYNRYEDKDELVSFGEYGIARGIPVQSDNNITGILYPFERFDKVIHADSISN